MSARFMHWDRRLASRRLSLGIGARLAVSTLLVLTLVTVAVTGHFIERTRRNLITSKVMAASMVGDLLGVALAPSLDFSDVDSARAELQNVRSNEALRAALLWSDGPEPIATLGANNAGLSRLRHAQRGDQVLTDEVHVVRPVLRADGLRLGTLVLVFSLERENRAFAAARWDILQFSSVVAMVTALLILAFARVQIVSPLARLVSAAQKLGAGDRTVRVEIARGDELGRLADVFNSMSSAIMERELRLEMATRSLRELFDHMAQGIVSFGPDGKLEGNASRQASLLFGERAAPGMNVVSLLYPGKEDGIEADAFQEWIQVAFSADAREWADVVELAPREVSLASVHECRYLRLEFRPVVAGGAIGRIMLLVNDETQLRTLAHQVKTKEQEHARQLSAMRRLIAGGGQVFVHFVEVAGERITRCLELSSSAHRASGPLLDELMQHVHTVRGEARAFELEELAAEALTLEDELSAIRLRYSSEGVENMESCVASWRRRLLRMRDALTRAQEVFVAASPIGAAILDQVTVSRRQIQRLDELVGQRADEVGAIARRLAARPFGELLAALVDRVPGWAEVVGKRARLEIEGKELPIPPALCRLLPGVVTHLVRNAIAHGIELPEERVRAHKPEGSVIMATCMLEGVRPTIVVEDDGRGIDFDLLAARAGLDSSDLLKARELLFMSGVSSVDEVSELAGRGVGLAAVRNELREIGWTVDVDPARRTGSAFIIREQRGLSSKAESLPETGHAKR